ncbi:acyltransferase family protein [Novosphingobium gossypii]|uniref:acyltransferase family protein n=1 Tax=Novosphingobium gossypii TaxID=1604774 RepID=UPI003D219F59
MGTIMGEGAVSHVRPPAENHLINLLRFGAALAVVLSHARTVLFVDYDAAPHDVLTTLAYGLTALGKEAVTVFFVLSGFWVGGAAMRKVESGRFAWHDYLSDRAIRLWLVLVPGLILTALIDVIGMQFFGEASVYAGDGRYQGVVGPDPFPREAWLFGANVLFLQGLFVEPFGSDGALWSVGYEFWMYVVGAAIIVCTYRRSAINFVIALLLLAGCTMGEPGRFPLYMMIWLLGAIVARASPYLKKASSRLSLTYVNVVRIGCAALLVAGALMVRGLKLPFEAGLFTVAALTAVLLATLVVRDDAIRHDSPFRWASWMAAFSFSLYVIHQPLLLFLVAFAGIDIDNRWQPDAVHWIAFGGVIASLLVAAYAFAAVTEKHTATVRSSLKAAIRLRRMPAG